MISSGSHCVATLVLRVVLQAGCVCRPWAGWAGQGLQRELVTRPWLGESTRVDESAAEATAAMGDGGLGRACIFLLFSFHVPSSLSTWLAPRGPEAVCLFSFRDLLQGGGELPQA